MVTLGTEKLTKAEVIQRANAVKYQKVAERRQKAKDLILQGKDRLEIQKEAGVSSSTYFKIISELGLEQARKRRGRPIVSPDSQTTEEIQQTIQQQVSENLEADEPKKGIVDLEAVQESLCKKPVAVRLVIDEKGIAKVFDGIDYIKKQYEYWNEKWQKLREAVQL